MLTSRQMGKTSLMVQTAARLREEGVAVAVLDLTAIGQNLTAEQWYNGLLGQIGQHLNLEDDLEDFWFEHERLGPLQRWMQALREIVLPSTTGRVVIFVDEIDVVQTLNDLNPQFSTDEFFAGIRAFYNRRTEDPELHRLSFCLLGVATPSDLIRDTRMTPFNIGRRIELRDFTEAEAQPLAQGLGQAEERGRMLLERVLYWTGGHPYLTQRLCRAVAEDASAVNVADVDRLCAELFLSPRARERDDNLIFVRERLLRSEADLVGLLVLYARIHKGRRVRDDETDPLISVLRLSGVVRARDGWLVVRNRIYAQAFDRAWVAAQMPDAELVRRRKVYRRRLLLLTTSALVIIAFLTWSTLKAINAQRVAEEAQQANRRLFYAASLSAAQQMWENGNIERMQELLDEQRPVPGRPDLRGFEWYYLWWLSHSYWRSFPQREIHSVQPGEIRSVAFSTDGQIVAAGSDDGNVKLWQVSRQSAVRLLKGNAGTVNAIAFLPDHRRLATGSDDGTVKVWEVETGNEVATLSGHTGSVRAVMVSPNQRQLITGSDDGMVIFREMNSWQQVGRPIKEARSPILSLALSPDGRTLALGSGQGTIELWDARRRRKRARLRMPSGTNLVGAVAFSPDSRKLAAGSGNGTIQVWSLTRTRAPLTLKRDDEAIFSLAFSPDGSRIAAAGDDRTVALWELATRSVSATFKGHLRAIHALSFSPDGNLLATGGRDGYVKVWKVSQPQEQTTLAAKVKRIQSVAFSPDRNLLAVSSGVTVRLWELGSQREVVPLTGHTDWISSLSFAPDGRQLATASDDQTVKLWDITSRQLLRTLISGTGEMKAVAFSPDGKIVAAGGQASDQAEGRANDQAEGQDRIVWLWETATGRELARLRGHKEIIQAIAFSPDGHTLATASRGGIVKLWDVTHLRLTATLKIQDDQLLIRDDAPLVPINAIAFSLDGRTLAVGSENGIVALWDWVNQKPRLLLKGHAEAIRSLAFAPGGRSLVTASKDKTVKFWDTERGQELVTFKAHTSEVCAVAFSLDGKMLVTGSDDGTLKLWQAPH